MIASLGVLLLLGAWHRGEPWVLGRALVILAVYSALDLFIGYWRARRWILPTSAWVSGLILALVMNPDGPFWLAIAAPILASASKHLLRFGRKHVFNPAAFALVLSGGLFPSASVVSWWGTSWGTIPLALIAVSGMVTIFRVKRWKTWLTFFPLFIIGGSLLLSLVSPIDHASLPSSLRRTLLDGTIWFFSTVMLIEPVTTAYQPLGVRTWFGAGVAVLIFLTSAATFSSHFLSLFLSPLLVRTLLAADPLLFSLLLGNLGAALGSRLLRRAR